MPRLFRHRSPRSFLFLAMRGAGFTLCASASALVACSSADVEPTENVESMDQELFDCNAPDQDLTCSQPANPSWRFVCHATGWHKHPYVKLLVWKNSSHQPGKKHHWWTPADQAPGASADDVGFGPGLDCSCHPRDCEGVCTGAPAGTACDDGDPCTADGSCSGDDCAPGTALPPGTSCGDDLVCTATGACVPNLVLNEIESSGGVPGDWVEIVNPGASAVDVSGWIFKDSDDTHSYAIPAGTTIAAGALLVLDEAAFGFGLGGADSARLFDAEATLVDSHSWTAHAATTYARCPNGTGAFTTSVSPTKGIANECGGVTINEIESSGGVPGDWVEIINGTGATVDLSGWVFKDSDDTHAYVIPAATTLEAGAYLVLDEATFGFGLGGADSARLFDAQAVLVDSHVWTAHAAVTYGRCPNGTGPFATTAASTKAAANDCGAGPPPAQTWPGANNVVTVDGTAVFGGNLSDLFYEPGAPDALWAARNGPGAAFRLVWNGSIWTPDTANDWGAGKALRYPDGSGDPDAEGVTKAESGSAALYVATERDNAADSVSRLSVLRFDSSDSGTTLVATHEWNLNVDLPVVGSNIGLEAITWVPDTFLVASAFVDEATGLPYSPASYPNHGTGLFFVSLEANGTIYAYALDHSGGGSTRVATIVSGTQTSKALHFDREIGYLWSHCGAMCGGVSSVLRVDGNVSSPTFGKFVGAAQYARPTTMANIANEGIAIAPESACVGGFKPFLWADDGETDGHALRADTVPCGAFIP